jgi:DNA (cytosine-5)-methyltransferase 1
MIDDINDKGRTQSDASKSHYFAGTKAPWYSPQNLTDNQRAVFKERSRSSHAAKKMALRGELVPVHPIYMPRLNPNELMPQQKDNGIRSLSVFSGGGGLDLGFDRAGFAHTASFEFLPQAAATITRNRPQWLVFSGDAGDVRNIDWSQYRDKIHVIHGGPPCQPFSSAGRQSGEDDHRDMFPQFVKIVLKVNPLAFVAENVSALGSRKFTSYFEQTILRPLSVDYVIKTYMLDAAGFGVPQVRKRIFIVGLSKSRSWNYQQPMPTHGFDQLFRQPDCFFGLFDTDPSDGLSVCMGAREALGLPLDRTDGLAPTLRSGLTGPRHTTSILSSASALKKWNQIGIWPNGVARTREDAHKFPAQNGDFRLSVPDCGILQGFPEDWRFEGAAYMSIGQIGNSVAPPVAYNVAVSLSKAFER